MQFRDYIIAGVRTGIQRLVTIGAALLTVWLAKIGFDIEIDPGDWQVAIDVLATGFVTSVLVKAEKKWSFLSRILSLGLAGNTVNYDQPQEPSPPPPPPDEVVDDGLTPPPPPEATPFA